MNIFVTGFSLSNLTLLIYQFVIFLSRIFSKSFVALLSKNEQKVFYREKSYCKATYVSLN